MTMRMRAFALLVPFLAALAATPANAETMAAADFQPGHTLGLGIAGASYDYGWRAFDLGAVVSSDLSGSSSFQHLQFGARGLWRFLDAQDFKASVIGGVYLDPGQVGQRSYLIPDLGLGVAYHTNFNGLPLAFRLNLTLTLDQGQGQAGIINPQPTSYDQGSIDLPPSRPNLLQRIIFGPNTNLGLGAQLGDHFELTLGGGTIVGMRYHY